MVKKNLVMLTGIYGDIIGREIEFSYFYTNRVLCPKDKPEIWPITAEVKKLLNASRKVATMEEVFEAWEHYAPEQLEGLKKYLQRQEGEYAFTDDTAMTIATMDALTKNPDNPDFKGAYLKWGRKYRNVGYGSAFRDWLDAEYPKPYRSFGNGSAMRVAPIGIATNSIGHCDQLAMLSAIPSHDHPEGIRGAKAIAYAVFFAKRYPVKISRVEFNDYLIEDIERRYFYDVSTPCEEIQKTYKFDSTCQGSVGQSIRAFIESTDSETAVRYAIKLGGDCDTMAMMAGSIAEAYYKAVPYRINEIVERALPDEMLDVIGAFYKKFKWEYKLTL